MLDNLFQVLRNYGYTVYLVSLSVIWLSLWYQLQAAKRYRVTH